MGVAEDGLGVGVSDGDDDVTGAGEGDSAGGSAFETQPANGALKAAVMIVRRLMVAVFHSFSIADSDQEGHLGMTRYTSKSMLLQSRYAPTTLQKNL